jgi:hypothetical protein
MVITAIVLLALMLPASAQTQAMNPESMLETLEIPGIDDTPEVTPDLPPSPSEWVRITRGMDCNSLAYIKSVLDARGQFLWAAGGFRDGWSTTDPFNGLIIVRNEATLEYTALLIKADINIACVIHSGQSIRSVAESAAEQ